MLLIVAIGFVDLRLGSAYHLSILYVVPTAAAGWLLGRRFGLIAGVLAGVNWDIADSVLPTDDVGASLCNGMTRVAVFAALAYLTATTRTLVDDLRERERELRDLLAQREEFLSLMAHEIRAPIAAIETVATGLLTAPTLSAPERAIVQRLLGQARSLTTLAEGVLTVGRLDAGLTRLDVERFDLRELVREIADDDDRTTADLPAVPLTVRADRSALHRALLNVVQNALKFSPPGSPVRLLARAGAGGAFVQVVDRGIGIAPEEKARLFKRYARAPRAEVRQADGVGLGLYFARLVVEAHRGTIDVHSDGHGCGSTFSIWLPTVAASDPVAVTA